MTGIIQLILRGGLDVSPADIPVLQSLPVDLLWSWLDGAQRRHAETRWFRAELLSAVYRAAGITINPETIYPTHAKTVDEKLAEIAKKLNYER